MAHLTIWFVALAAGCSAAPEQGALDLSHAPPRLGKSSTHATGPPGTDVSAFSGARGSSNTAQELHVGRVEDKGVSPAAVGELSINLGRSVGGSGGEVTAGQLETDAKSPTDAAPSVMALETAPRPSGKSASHTQTHNVPTAASSESSVPLSASHQWDAVAVSSRMVAAGPRSNAGERASRRPASGSAELQGPLGGAGRSRHRPEPGLAPAEKKQSSRRNGVPELEMLENTSKPRKGVPPPPLDPDSAVPEDRPSSRRFGVTDLENPSKARKGVPPPPPPSLLSLVVPAPDMARKALLKGGTVPGTARPHMDAAYAGPEELAGEPESRRNPNLAKAHISMLVGVVFVVLFVLVLGWFVLRKISDSWQHRHYRKMDFLIDGMYNI